MNWAVVWEVEQRFTYGQSIEYVDNETYWKRRREREAERDRKKQERARERARWLASRR